MGEKTKMEKRPNVHYGHRIGLPGMVVSALLALILFVAQEAETQTLEAAEGMHWYHQVAEQGDMFAQYNLGTMYAQGKGVPQDYTEAAHWFRLAAEQGLASAQSKLGTMYSEGKGAPQDHTKAAHWWRQAAEQGHAWAQYNLAKMYRKGIGVSQDDAEAMRWYHQAAEQENALAQLDLGVMRYRGEGGPKDDIEAAYWFRQAAKQGLAFAQGMLGAMYATGEGVPQDKAEAVRWFLQAAEQGFTAAQYNLGLMYAKGEGVSKDVAMAVRWFRQAAKQGDADAQANLGVMYDEGEGVPEDDAEAVRWFRRAAEQGHATAQFKLGVMYAKGAGVLHDDAEAVRWLRRAAEQGVALAQSGLGLMYEKGRGVPQDYVQAHKWFNLGASQMTSSEREWRDSVVRHRTHVMSKMTSVQIAEAQRLAREWKPKQFVVPAPDAPEKRRPSVRYPVEMASTGSGFFVSNNGHILTNAHVVSECADVRIPPAVSVRVAARDDSSDLALLWGEADSGRTFATFRQGRGIRPGADVVVIGYPLQGVVASEANVTRGNVSALAGPGDDRRLFQMTAPIQPGNSGGPVLDMSGHVVGVTVAKLNAIKTARATGDIPQNVNFAVSAGTARSFLDAEGVPYETARSSDTLAPDVVASRAKEFTVLVECWK